MTSDPVRRQCFVVDGDGSRTVVLVVDGEVAVELWPIDAFRRPDLDLVDRLARLQLAAHRCGWSIRLQNPCAQLRGLLDLVGLADALRLEPWREPEGGEQRGVEEVVEPGDPPA